MAQATKTKKIFDGRYELIGIVGRGSHSVVYHARHTFVPSSQVALKVLIAPQKKTSDGENLNDKLRKEALAMVSARHKYVIRIDDFHSIESLCYLSMEYAPEGDLRKFTQSFGGKLPAPLAERFLKQAAEALQFIHRAGMIHRDIKPDNILVMNENEIRIADFGVAVLPHEKFNIQELQAGVGTMDYMAPEVLQGVEYKQAADIYALGVTFYELISGVHPFKDASMLQQLDVRKSENLRPLDQLVQGVPKLLSQAIMKAMQYSPADRFESGKALLDFLVGKPQEATQKPLPARAVEKTEPSAPIKPRTEESPKATTPAQQQTPPKPAEPKPTAAEILIKGAAEPKSSASSEERPEKLSAASILKRLEALKEQQQQGSQQKSTPNAVEALDSAKPQPKPPPSPESKPASSSPPASSASASASAVSAGMFTPAPRESTPKSAKFEIPNDQVANQPSAQPPPARPAVPPQPAKEPTQKEAALKPESGAKQSQPTTGASKALFAEPNEAESDDEIFEAQLRKIKEKSQALKADKERIAKKALTKDRPSAQNLGVLISKIRALGPKRLIIIGAALLVFYWLSSGTSSAPKQAVQNQNVTDIPLPENNSQNLLPTEESISPGDHGVSQTDSVPVETKVSGLSFPILPSGFYYGKVHNLFGMESLPIALISFSEKKKVAIIIGREGWTPDVVSLEGLEAGRELRTASNGTMLELVATRSDDIRIVGTARNITGLASGTFELQKR